MSAAYFDRTAGPGADEVSARRQLAFDIWWLGFALWLVCIIEVSDGLHWSMPRRPAAFCSMLTGKRGNIVDAENATWFNIFNIIFELVSAYGTVGLSLGLPYDNYS